MIKTSTLHKYARVGAAVRITELQAEIGDIQKMFPDLGGTAPPRKRPGRPPARLKAQSAASPALAELMDSAGQKRQRRKMSAAGRKAISDAQKKRWAALKAKK